jgi:hypothetical protein
VIRAATSGCSCPGSAKPTTRPGTAEAHGGRAAAAQGKNGGAKAVTNLRTPNAAARPAASVTANAESTSQPQASPPMPNPSAVSAALLATSSAPRG